MRIINIVSDSQKGKTKSENQDKFLKIVNDNYYLFFLFDGISSASNAKKCINLAISFIKKNYKNYYRDNNFLLSLMMYDTNNYILSSRLPESFSTYVGLVIPINLKQSIKFSSLGDSRIYGISNQYVEQHNKDDRRNSKSNTITRFLGNSELNKEDFEEIYLLNPENRLLLCSDGFYNLMNENKLKFLTILNFVRLKNIKKSLNKEINNKNIDDSTYLLVNQNVQNGETIS